MDNTSANLPNETTIKLTPLFSLSLIHNMYKINIGDELYMVKVFSNDKVNNYYKQKEILGLFNYPFIIKPAGLSSNIINTLQDSLKSSFIVFPFYQTDLLEFVKNNGSLSERVAKYFLNQILQALIHAQQKGVIHPNLIAQNILLNKNTSVLLSGWSNSLGKQNPTLQNLLFSIGELIINFCTSRKPFISREPKNDAFAKFLNEKYIHKFWEQIEKVVKKSQNSFQFSKELKQLVSALFLKKIDSLQKARSFIWLNEQINQAQIHNELSKQQSNAVLLKQSRKNKMIAAQLQQKQLANNKGGMNIHRKPSRAHDLFQQEYENFQQIKGPVFQKSKSDTQIYFKLYDKNLRILIAHLKARLKQAQRDQQDLIDPLLLLKDPQVTYQNSQIKINCNFGWNYNLILQNNLLIGFDYSATILVRQEQGALLGRIETSQKSELNAECIIQMNKWLVQNLQHNG